MAQGSDLIGQLLGAGGRDMECAQLAAAMEEIAGGRTECPR
jgi:hypothetical protein